MFRPPSYCGNPVAALPLRAPNRLIIGCVTAAALCLILSQLPYGHLPVDVGCRGRGPAVPEAEKAVSSRYGSTHRTRAGPRQPACPSGAAAPGAPAPDPVPRTSSGLRRRPHRPSPHRFPDGARRGGPARQSAGRGTVSGRPAYASWARYRPCAAGPSSPGFRCCASGSARASSSSGARATGSNRAATSRSRCRAAGPGGRCAARRCIGYAPFRRTSPNAPGSTSSTRCASRFGCRCGYGPTPIETDCSGPSISNSGSYSTGVGKTSRNASTAPNGYPPFDTGAAGAQQTGCRSGGARRAYVVGARRKAAA